MRSFTGSRLMHAVAPRGRLARTIGVVVCAGLLATACDVHGVSDPGTLATLEITPNPQTLAINATQQFTVVGKDFSGAIVSVEPVWSVATSGGAINTSGMFTAGSLPGTFTNTVTATSGGKTATATVVVLAGPLATITLTPTPVTLAIGATQQYVAIGKDASGNIVPFTPTWSVVAGGGSISSTGLFTAGTVSGTYANTVQASNNAIKATGTVTVTPGALATLVVSPNPITLNSGATQQYSAVGKDASGNTVVVTPVWSVAAGGGTINATGLFTAGATPGTFANTVKAVSGSISGTATVSVLAGPIATITVLPNPTTLAIGATQQFTAIATDASGNVIPITPAWSIAAGGGTIDFATGVFTAGSTTGTFANTVRASVGSVNGFATVTVIAGPGSSLTVTPAAATLQTNATQQFTAVVRDAGGNVVAASIVWGIANRGGTISSSGLFTAGTTPGAFANTVTATNGTLTGSASVTVTPVVSTITVTPNPAVVPANGTQQFSAIGTDVNGNPVAITPVWSVVNGGGTINANTGVFTAGAAGGTFALTIKATSGAASGFATVTVSATPPVLTTITVTPNPASMNTGQTQQFTAVGRDQNGAVFLFTPVWSVTNATAGTISAGGLFTAGATPGTYANAVRATSGATFGTATVIVGTAAAPIVSLGNAAPNGIMAGTAVSCAGPATIAADVSISPGSTISGPCVVSGVQHLGDPAAALAQTDLTAAYNTLMGLACPPANIITADLGGTTKLPGVYCSPASTMGLTGVLTLNGNGDPNATFVFQVGSGLTVAGDVVLINGAQAKNVYFVVGSSATLGTASHFQGNIVALTSITLVTGTTLNGRALARNGAVTLGTGSSITLP